MHLRDGLYRKQENIGQKAFNFIEIKIMDLVPKKNVDPSDFQLHIKADALLVNVEE